MSNSKHRTTLADIFGPAISYDEALACIKAHPVAYEKFITFSSEYQQQIIEFMQGSRGLPLLYDGFFKSIFDPVSTPERLERFLSCLLKQNVTIIDVLTREGSQLVELGTLVVMDIIVKLEDGSYINVEMQKYGYKFPGERSTCYMSDLIMRQYNRVKSEKQQKFSFKDMKPVYLIVLMEHSSANFSAVSPHYVHRLQYSFDTGAETNLLTNYIYISLDTFHAVVQNVSSYMDAWLMFLSSDSPEDVINLVESYPEFKAYYHDIALFRKNPKELMNMYSEVLLKMDQNTVLYMIEEMQQEVEELRKVALEAEELRKVALEAEELKKLVLEKDTSISEKNVSIAKLSSRVAELEAQLAQNKQ